MRKIFPSYAGVIAIISLLFTCGCPDYSHLRQQPDYENMTDGGAEPGIDSDVTEDD